MTLTFSSLEDAWGGKTSMNEFKSSRTNKGNSISNVTKSTASLVNSTTFDVPKQQDNGKDYVTPSEYWNTNNNNDYEDIYCNNILNHIQGCEYCRNRLKALFSSNICHAVPEEDNTIALTPEVLNRKHDNLAYVPFGLDPEVFNILLFSTILISLIFLIDKKGLKHFKF